MNNILLNNSNSSYDFNSKSVTINVLGNSKAIVKSIPKDFSLEINANKSSNIVIELNLTLDNNNLNIIINDLDNVHLDLNMAVKYKNNNIVNLISNIKGNNNSINIKVRCVEDNGALNILAEGRVNKNTSNNYYNEDIKAIVENNNSIVIKPNLCVSSFVSAFHNATISNINKDELFYLESLGMNKDTGINLIKEGFLKGILTVREGDFNA